MRRFLWLCVAIGLIAGGCAPPPAGLPVTPATASAVATILPIQPPTGEPVAAATPGATAAIASLPTAEPVTDTLPVTSPSAVETATVSAGAQTPEAPAAPTQPAGLQALPPATGTPGGDTGATTSVGSSPRVGNPLVSGDLPYLDDRSTPQRVLESYANALNRKEYLRAYSYWGTPAGASGGPPPYAQFAQGFANTEKVQISLGVVSGDVGAGQIYYSVPVVFAVNNTGGGQQLFAGCYILHLGRPAIQAAPPFDPLGIESAKVRQVPAGSGTQALLATACQGSPQGGAPEIAPPPATPADISAAHYIDDRSGPVQVLRSLFNAINRQEYARAYGYWQAPTSEGGPPPFQQFQQGYADTQTVQLAAGEPQSGVGAGQIYFQVPVTLHAQKTNGQAQTFVGCYTLHISQPAVQGVPPFQPLAIANASVREVAANADTASLMARACQ